MNTISSLLKIQYPIIQAGMVWCSGWRLASAVSNAGGLGLIGAGSMSPEILREHIIKCKAATPHSFGVNIPLIYSHALEQIHVAIEQNVKVVFTSAGNPAIFTSRLKDAGITVVHVVANSKFAKKAEASGVDAVVAEGFEAGGHNGREETTTMCLIPLIKEQISVPVIAAGGISTGRTMLAAMALGAEGVQIGSAFAVAKESSAHANFKQKVIEAGEGDTRLCLKSLTPVPLLKNSFSSEIEQAELRGADKEILRGILGKGRAKLGIFEGDLAAGELEIGQVSGILKEVRPAAEILKGIVLEFERAKSRICEFDW
ncbi:NAD(P)H-dependent flavin oxidoreductase [Desertivirga arenae]|uniref:NAD(P)H-dependent flavin oxidoreductase n=1 Tax=Desertivirga arenae TaxID=2810309 RepID=UPI001A972B2E|nr:nitronate monooxygenase [Pedobacter sp. SYSU D00823]